MMESSANNLDLSSAQARFRHAALRLIEFTRQPDFSMIAFANADLPLFMALDPQKQTEALERIETMVSILNATGDRHASIRDSAAVLETFFQHGSYSSTPDVFTHLEADDFIEIYNCHSHKLIFANNIINARLSYTLEELFCTPWPELLSRDVYGVHEQIYGVIQEIIVTAKPKIIFASHIPDHICRETKGRDRRAFIIFPRFFAPIFKNGESEAPELAGYLCVNKVFPYDEPQDEGETA